MKPIEKYLQAVLENQGSDLHVSAGLPPKIRIHGRLEPLNKGPLTNEEVEDLLFPILTESQAERFRESGDLDFAYEVRGVARFRVNFFQQINGMGGVFRIIPTEIKSVTELGMPEAVEEFAALRAGLVLVTGPTGSGKSTTLAALIDYINRTSERHIITIEDPIEYTHVNKRSVVTQREVHHEARSFSQALKAAAREDPDVVLVGEMRDLETISLAITLAEMGLLVFATLHTNHAAKTVDRIIDSFPHDQQPQIRTMLSTSLKGVCSQLLCRRKDGRGRIPVAEILKSTSGLPNVIREGKIEKIISIIEGGRGEGMQKMDDHILARYNAGEIDGEEAFMKAFEKSRFQHVKGGV